MANLNRLHNSLLQRCQVIVNFEWLKSSWLSVIINKYLITVLTNRGITSHTFISVQLKWTFDSCGSPIPVPTRILCDVNLIVSETTAWFSRFLSHCFIYHPLIMGQHALWRICAMHLVKLGIKRSMTVNAIISSPEQIVCGLLLRK